MPVVMNTHRCQTDHALFFADVLYSHVECLQLNSIPEPH
jgi:hypothetical protein